MSCDNKGPEAATECTPCSPGIRSHYFRGKMLTVADYAGEQNYMNHRRRMTNRSMWGWGVIAGFRVRGDGGAMTVEPGLALDPEGREILACKKVSLRRPDDVLWLEPGKGGLTIGQPPRPPQMAQAGRDQMTQDDLERAAEQEKVRKPRLYLLAAHYGERLIDPVRIGGDCGEEQCEANRICETVVYSLRPIEDCDSGLQACMAGPSAGAACVEAPFDAAATPLAPAAERPSVKARGDRGPQSTLCGWSDRWLSRDGFDPCRSVELTRCKGSDVAVDPDAGVALACLEVTFDRCDDPVFGRIVDSCGPRRLMRPNDLLFDLIRGCDLTVIQDIGWLNWHRLQGQAVPRRSFETIFVTPKQKRYVQTNFWVCLSGPVKLASLTPEVVTITLIRRDEDEDIGIVRRMPVTGIRADPPRKGDPPGTTRRFSPLVSYKFYHGEINRDAASGFSRPNQVEIEIDGDRIIAADGQPIDANTRGLDLPSGNGTPGGRFRSVFSVHPRATDQISPHPSVPPPSPAPARRIRTGE